MDAILKICHTCLSMFSLLLCAILLFGCRNEQALETNSRATDNTISERFGGRLSGIQNLDDIYSRAESGDSSFQLFLGEALFNTGKTQNEKAEGVEWIQKAAEQDNSSAFFLLASCYAEGNGVEKDYVKAAKWFEKAAEVGNLDAQYQLALCYIEGKGIEQNKEYGTGILLKLAGQSSADTKVKAEKKLNELGIQSDENSVKEQITNIAQKGNHPTLSAIRKLADAGEQSAQFALGRCYAEGIWVEQDDTEAFNWFQKAATTGHADSEYNVAICYLYGKGTDQNKAKGIDILRDLAKRGFGEAQTKLVELSKECE